MFGTKSKSLIILLFTVFFSLSTVFSVYSQSTYPQRIISFAPSLTEQLYILGVGDRLVGCTIYCRRPPQAKKKEKIGTAIEVNLEKVVTLEPDLVLTSSLTSPRVKNKLENLGVMVITCPAPKSFSGISQQFLRLGSIVGKKELAKDILSKVEKEISSITKRIKSFDRPKVFVQIGAKPLFAATSSSFINDYIRFAGALNIAENAKQGIYSREEVLRKNPDVIIIVTMGIAGDREKEIWEKYRELNAAKNNRIYIVDSDRFCSPTPLNFIESLEETVNLLYFQGENK